MAVPISVKRRFDRKLPRLVKATRHWMQAVAAGGRPDTRIVFVIGSQRSGTRLPIHILDSAPDIATYSEGTSPYFNRVLLAPLERIEQLIRRSPSPIVALKPICETHRVNELLDRFPGSRAIWIFRHYQDAVNSASVKWTSGIDSLRRIARRELKPGDWRAGGLSEERLALASRLYRDGMSLHEANAVIWYLRNVLFFDLRADARRDVLLVRYEDLVASPNQQFGRVFRFIGTDVPRRAVDAIHGSVRTRRAFPEISPEVRQLCEDLHGRMLAHYRESVPVSQASREQANAVALDARGSAAAAGPGAR